MALSTYIKTNCHGRLYLVQGATELLCPFENGNFKLEGFKRRLNEVVVFEGRGKLQGTGLGKRIYPTFSFECKLAELTNVTAGVITDWFMHTGGYSSLGTDEGTLHPIDTYGLRYELDGTTYGDAANGTISMARCDFDLSFSEQESGPTMLALSGRVLAAISGSIAAAERA